MVRAKTISLLTLHAYHKKCKEDKAEQTDSSSEDDEDVEAHSKQANGGQQRSRQLYWVGPGLDNLGIVASHTWRHLAPLGVQLMLLVVVAGSERICTYHWTV